MWYMHDIGWGWWLLMSLGMVALWGLVIWAVVALLRGDRFRTEEAEDRDRPLDILQLRLARGEITAAEYEELRDSLMGTRSRRDPEGEPAGSR